MKNIQLEARLKNKTLSVNGKGVNLNDSLICAEKHPIDKTQMAVDLTYGVGKGFDAEDEADKIYDFFQKIEVDEILAINYDGDTMYPAVSITGKMQAEVYK